MPILTTFHTTDNLIVAIIQLIGWGAFLIYVLYDLYKDRVAKKNYDKIQAYYLEKILHPNDPFDWNKPQIDLTKWP